MGAANRNKGAGEELQGQGAATQLLEDIRSGRLLPGARLREMEIATRLGISRTPVREAIRRLEADGLVSYLPRVGAVVRQLSYPEVMELYEMRWVLEGTAARLAARGASGVEIEELAAINVDMIREGQSPQELVALNRQFHNTLIAAARNRYLVRSVRTIETTLLILGPTTMEDPSRARAAVEEHQAVVEALRIRDEAAAEAMMRAHIESAQRTRLRQLRSHGRLMEADGPDYV
ncbi:GntR family transcriptional regulator [Nitratireductor luteus]|uniref:GntR family transcriptional regulator n=1 Tax=Nitratireductor luteus TaxID=2976980 RepID=UPI00223ED191|nr:GntR family transcriptional regulator [Nitratireductor luteus]